MTEENIAGENVVIIGDTPADVACARAGGATAIAVASGWHTADTLLQYQPDYLFADLCDTAAVVKVLLGN
jgi:phosphoglycolate phosphatase-like HAD superfamily hydrolase